MVLLISSVAYAPWIFASYNMFQYDLVFIFIIIGGTSPTIAALIVAKIEFEKKGAKYLFSQFFRRGFSKSWFLVAFLIPLALAAFSVSFWSIARGSYTLELTRLFDFPLALIASFLMNVWEEIGWRGYALPELQKKYNALISSVIVGVFWALWHWPHFAVKDSIMAINYNNFLLFIVFMPLYSISYTWLYNSSNGSLFITSLYHASTNASNTILFFESNASSSIFPFYFLTVILFALIIVSAFKPDSLSLKKRAILD